MPALPTALKIGFKDYEIGELSLDEVLAEDRLGDCNDYAGTIRVAVENRRPQDVAETLLHETLHAIWHTHKLQDGDDEERIVSVTAAALAQVLRDNPLLRQFLNEVFGYVN